MAYFLLRMSLRRLSTMYVPWTFRPSILCFLLGLYNCYTECYLNCELLKMYKFSLCPRSVISFHSFWWEVFLICVFQDQENNNAILYVVFCILQLLCESSISDSLSLKIGTPRFILQHLRLAIDLYLALSLCQKRQTHVECELNLILLISNYVDDLFDPFTLAFSNFMPH